MPFSVVTRYQKRSDGSPGSHDGTDAGPQDERRGVVGHEFLGAGVIGGGQREG